MKQVEMTAEQKEKFEFGKKIIEMCIPPFDDREQKKCTRALKEMLGITDPYPTLREYLNEHCIGAYHSFNCELVYDGGTKVKASFSSISSFVHFYGERHLDRYYVVKDDAKDNGGNCENYHCEHTLTLELKED